VDPGSATTPSAGAVRYMAPELLNPSGFGLEDSIPTKESDIYAFGMVTYQVRNPRFIISSIVQRSVQIITGHQPFPGAKDGLIIYNIVAGERPGRPLDPNEWVSDNVWYLISRCWSSSLKSRPDAKLAKNTLTDAVEAGHETLHATANGQREIIRRRVSGTLYFHRPRVVIDYRD